jgi:hypothetical protein
MAMVWARISGGALLALIGVIWILQGSGATGASGGMNGESQWLLIGVIVAIVGVVMVVGGIKRLRAGKTD